MASQPSSRGRKAAATKPEAPQVGVAETSQEEVRGILPEPAPIPEKVDPRAKAHTVHVAGENITLGLIVH